jgi:hypothetical protein
LELLGILRRPSDHGPQVPSDIMTPAQKADSTGTRGRRENHRSTSKMRETSINILREMVLGLLLEWAIP